MDLIQNIFNDFKTINYFFKKGDFECFQKKAEDFISCEVIEKYLYNQDIEDQSIVHTVLVISGHCSESQLDLIFSKINGDKISDRMLEYFIIKDKNCSQKIIDKIIDNTKSINKQNYLTMMSIIKNKKHCLNSQQLFKIFFMENAIQADYSYNKELIALDNFDLKMLINDDENATIESFGYKTKQYLQYALCNKNITHNQYQMIMKGISFDDYDHFAETLSVNEHFINTLLEINNPKGLGKFVRLKKSKQYQKEIMYLTKLHNDKDQLGLWVNIISGGVFSLGSYINDFCDFISRQDRHHHLVNIILNNNKKITNKHIHMLYRNVDKDHYYGFVNYIHTPIEILWDMENKLTDEYNLEIIKKHKNYKNAASQIVKTIEKMAND